MAIDSIGTVVSTLVGALQPAPARERPRAESGRQAAQPGGRELPQEAQPQDPERDRLAEAVSQINEFIQNAQRELRFAVDEDTGRTVVKVIDPATDEVIRQIPPDEVLAVARQLSSLEGVILKALA